MKAFLKEIVGRPSNTRKKGSIADPTMNAPLPAQAVELGTIDYVNLTPDRKHGDYQTAVAQSLQTGKPIFANFVEWSGWRGCKDAGAIFAHPAVKRAAEELFVPCAFNTWDRDDPRRNQAMKQWSAGLASSWWGYLRIVEVNSEGQSLVVTGTKQITGRHQLKEVIQVLKEALEDLGMDIPDYLK